MALPRPDATGKSLEKQQGFEKHPRKRPSHQSATVPSSAALAPSTPASHKPRCHLTLLPHAADDDRTCARKLAGVSVLVAPSVASRPSWLDSWCAARISNRVAPPMMKATMRFSACSAGGCHMLL